MLQVELRMVHAPPNEFNLLVEVPIGTPTEPLLLPVVDMLDDLSFLVGMPKSVRTEELPSLLLVSLGVELPVLLVPADASSRTYTETRLEKRLLSVDPKEEPVEDCPTPEDDGASTVTLLHDSSLPSIVEELVGLCKNEHRLKCVTVPSCTRRTWTSASARATLDLRLILRCFL